MVACAMGFSAHLQSRAAHEALLARQDAELRLLDSMRRCVASKLKCDREYALALAAVAAQGFKVERPDDLAGSLVAKAWRSMLEEMDGTGRLLRQGADALETRALERLNALYAEKRRARKLYQEEHSRIAQQLSQLTDDVSRKKAEYQKYLELYRGMRSRFEEHYIKAGRGGRKLDEVRDKFQKACRKLHLTHNEYVLLLSEAAEFEREYRQALLPGLLQRHQAAQEAFVRTWSEVLREVAKNLSFSNDKFGELQQRVDAAVTSIRPADEYADFTERHKAPVPAAPSFAFDDRLVEDTSGKLLPGRLAVDNLTVESLRAKLTELEAALRELHPAEPAPAPATVPAATPAAAGGSPTAAAPPTANGGSGSRHCSTSSEAGRAEAAERSCRERQLQRQLDLVRGALSELGCEELPSGCELAGLDASFGESQPQPPASSPATAPPSPPSGGRSPAMDGPPAPTTRPPTPAAPPPPPPGSQGEESAFTTKRHLAQQRLVELLRKPFRRKSIPSTPVLGRAEPGPRGGSVPAEDKVVGMQYLLPGMRHSAYLLPMDHDWVVPAAPPPARSLADEDWFHGVLPREEVVRLLTREGDFLVRETTRNDECQTVLSVCWGGHKHFIVQTTAEGHFRFEGPAFPTIQELIAHQYQSGLPVTGRSGAVLRKPVLRERWELNNDDVILLDKIGRGNFGDVYKAKLKTSRQEVAVKTCRMTLPDEHKKKFLQEGRILKQYDHPNIVKLIGICVQKQPIMIVMELVPGGSLLTFLRNRAATLTQKQLLGMCRDAAAGMRYLESKNCIHRDLAARNCLIGYDNTVKISDFGMSREEEEYIVSDGMKQIPIKWTAPEALNFGKYTSLCDVWSYGVLSWEIFSRGGTPYTGMSNSKAREKIDAGYRMPAPEGTPDEMYRLMLRCWEYEPENRPHFEQIYLVVDTLYCAQR